MHPTRLSQMRDTYLNCSIIVVRWLKELEIVPGCYLHTTLCRLHCLINHEMIPITRTVSWDFLLDMAKNALQLDVVLMQNVYDVY